MKLTKLWDWLTDNVDEFKRLTYTGQSGRNPVYARLRIDVEQEDGTTINLDQTIGKRLTAAQKRKLEEELWAKIPLTTHEEPSDIPMLLDLGLELVP